MADNVLIINLTRFGDLLQTQPLLSGLAANGANCGLVCLANFVDAVPMMRHVSRHLQCGNPEMSIYYGILDSRIIICLKKMPARPCWNGSGS